MYFIKREDFPTPILENKWPEDPISKILKIMGGYLDILKVILKAILE